VPTWKIVAGLSIGLALAGCAGQQQATEECREAQSKSGTRLRICDDGFRVAVQEIAPYAHPDRPARFDPKMLASFNVRSNPKVSLADRIISGDFSAGACSDHSTVFHDVNAIGNGERGARVLLDEQNRRS
jgi:hypothetical protein